MTETDATILYNDTHGQTESKLILFFTNKNNKGSIDRCLFVGWDSTNKDYFVRGRRQDIISQTQQTDFVPFAFHCDSTHDLFDFIQLVLGRGEKNISLYNYNNLFDPNSKESDMNYEFFESYLDKDYEIVKYQTNLNRMETVRTLRMLQNMYNWGGYHRR